MRAGVKYIRPFLVYVNRYQDMHIALCDDNFGDRHQTERLLRRESDRQEDSAGMYIVDSYGSPETIMSHPRAYDLFIIDLCKTDGVDACEVVKKLVESGADAPFVMCCSDVDYRQMDFPENTMFIDKPIKVKYSHLLGRRYDTSFKPDNNLFYCSELIHHIYLKQFGVELCKYRKVSSYHIIGLKKRLIQRGINLEQKVVAPIDIYNSKQARNI